MIKRGGSSRVKKQKFDKAKYQRQAGIPVEKRHGLVKGGMLGPGTHKATWWKRWF